MTEHEYVQREEFEARLDQLDEKVERGFLAVGKRFDALLAKIDEKEQRRVPKLWEVLGLVVAAIAGIGIPTAIASFALVFNMADTRAIQSWMHGHQESSDLRDASIAHVREEQTRVTTKLDEQEMQHRWMADALNLRFAAIERAIRMIHPEVPAFEYQPLNHIGQATER